MPWWRWLNAVVMALCAVFCAVDGHLDLFMNETETKRLLGEYRPIIQTDNVRAGSHWRQSPIRLCRQCVPALRRRNENFVLHGLWVTFVWISLNFKNTLSSS